MRQRVAIYCRLSEEDRNKQHEGDDSNSIQNQKAMLLQYAAEKGWEVFDLYSDDDYAGADRRRPEFNRLLADAEAHRFDIVLCKTQSRFTRELELVEKYIHGLFPLWNIRFVSIVDNADTANRGNKKSRQINGLVNEWYLEDMSDNIRSVLTSRRQEGYHIGSFALYGYKKDPEQKGHLIIDEEAAVNVREVFSLYSYGYGKTAIARILNDRGIPNPTEYKRLQGLRYKSPKSKNSTLWKYYTIAAMLENEMYIGNMVQGRYGSVSYKTKQNRPRPRSDWYVVKGTHEPIIDQTLWDRVQALRAQRARPFSTGAIGLFSGKARCACCGYTLHSSKNRGKHYLQCPTHHISKDACIGSFISVDQLEQIVIAALNRLSAEYLDKNQLLQQVAFCNDLQEQKKQLLNDLSAYEKKTAEYSKANRNLYLDKVRGLINEGDFLEMSKGFAADRERLERRMQDTRQQIAETEKRIAAGDNRHELIDQYTNPEHLSREAVEVLIDYILVGKRAPGEKTAPIEIHWNF
ncbi:MAG: recombinase family protein [Clostridiales bacterium]|nr:recombinase family protein [Clostridiales bacterium]